MEDTLLRKPLIKVGGCARGLLPSFSDTIGPHMLYKRQNERYESAYDPPTTLGLWLSSLEYSIPRSQAKFEHRRIMDVQLPTNYTIDVHTHPIPEFYREAIINAGYPFVGKDLRVDGFVVPEFDIDSYLQNRKDYHYDFSILSISAPGLAFLNGNSRAKTLARRCNDQMSEWIRAHPDKLGAFACLPLPDVEASLEEIRYCLDELHFEGVGLFTNYNGRYLGDAFLDPIFAELDRRKTTVLVHPIAPAVEVKLPNIGTPAIEYTFDTTRAITNLSFTGTRMKFPNFNMIFSHGGGTAPFLATRIAGQASLAFQGGRAMSDVMDELKSYYFDLAAGTSHPQLAALNTWVGPGQLLMGSDFPYFPAQMIPVAQASFEAFSDFNEKDKAAVRHGNALSLFPRIVEKLSKRKQDTNGAPGQS